jgi:hypothetical protein
MPGRNYNLKIIYQLNKKNTMKIKLLLFACFIIWLQGCDSDDEETYKGEYQHGVLVANEGGFQKHGYCYTL